MGLKWDGKHGFTLMEILFALGLMSVFALLTVSMMRSTSGNDKSLQVTQAAATEIVQAYLMYQKKNGIPLDTTSPQDIVNYMNYVRLVNDGSLGIQVFDATYPDPPCDAGTTSFTVGGKTYNYGDSVAAANGSRVTEPFTDQACNMPCETGTFGLTCAVLQSGAVVMFANNARFGAFDAPPTAPPYNRNALRFYIDPDGPDSRETATAFLLFYGGRISSDENSWNTAKISYSDGLGGYIIEDRANPDPLILVPLDKDEAPVLPATTGLEPINGTDGVLDDPEYLWKWSRG